jgi:DNA-binding response OmpR family regulator
MAQLQERATLLSWERNPVRLATAQRQSPPAPEASEPARILVIEASDSLEPPLCAALTHAGFVVSRVRTGQAALQTLEGDPCDLVLVQGEPLGMSAFQLCRELRRLGQLPLIFLAVHDALSDRLLAFDLGVDDDISGSVAFEEIERRIRALLRRARRPTHQVTLKGPGALELHMLQHAVHINDSAVAITTKEFELLRLLLERRGEVLALDTISLSVWGYETMGSRNFVEAHISRLRAKLSAAGARGVIETVRGFGYVIR